MIVFDEMPGMSNIVITPEIWNALIVSGVLGFLINIAIFMQVKYTTPLTNAISGTAKVTLVVTALAFLRINITLGVHSDAARLALVPERGV